MKNNVVFRPTVVIGLGGTGYNALLKLKQRFIDAYGSVPPIIRFLSFDTTENSENSSHSSGCPRSGHSSHSSQSLAGEPEAQ